MSTNSGLEIKEDLRREKIEWMVQRVCWWMMLLLLAAALLGAFGRGPLSSRSLSDGGGALVSYEALSRVGSPQEIEIQAPVRPGVEPVVAISGDFFERLELSDILPGPLEIKNMPGGIELRFASPTSGVLKTALKLKPKRAGALELRISIMNGTPLDLRQFVFP